MAQQTTNVNGVLRARIAALAGVAGLALGAQAWGQVANPEAEPNDSKSSATVASSGGLGMLSGDFITGASTGTSTTVAGDTSADYFRVKTRPAASGVYRHRLVVTTPGSTGFVGTIRGLNQSSSIGIGTVDSTMQTSATVEGSPATTQWYGFGKGEELFYRVTGTTSTTSGYTSTLTTTSVTVPDSGSINPPGSVTISSIGQGHTTDTDFWVYDPQLNAMPDFGNDDESIAGGGAGTLLQSLCTRTLTPGTYTLAISNWNTCNNLASPNDDDYRAGIVLDLPDAIANTSTTTGLNVSVAITGSGGTTPVSLTKAGPFDIAFTSFLVGSATSPVGSGTASPNNVTLGDTVNFSVAVTPVGQPNPSTGITVVANVAALGGTTLNLTDPDGDLTFTGSFVVGPNTGGGQQQIPFTVADAQARSSNGNINLRVSAPPASTDLGIISTANQGALVTGVTVDAATMKWFKFAISADAAAPSYLEITSNGSDGDTEIGVYSANGTLQDSDDDDGILAASALSWGAGSGTQLGGTFTTDTAPVTGTGQDGALTAGTYYLAVGRFNVTFGTTEFNATTTSTGPVSVTLNFATNIPGGATCDSIDFNGDGVFPDLTDIVDFFFVFGGGDCPTATCNDIDFNNDGVFPDLQDVIKFLDVFGGGNC